MTEDDRYAPLIDPEMRQVVIAQLGQSLDGRIATVNGHSHYVTGAEDRRHLHRLRSLVDAVVIGASTVAADDPRLTVRDVEGPDPLRIVLDPRGRLPANRRVFEEAPETTVLVLGEGVISPASAVVDTMRLPLISAGGFDPVSVLARLADRGCRRVLVEGGGRLVSACLHAGVLDYLYLSIAPVIIGSGIQGLDLPPISHMSAAHRPPARCYALGQDMLFRLDLRGAAA